MNADQKPKGKFNFGGSRATQLLVGAVAIALLFIIGLIIYGVVAPKDSTTTLFVALTQDQQEIVRVATLGSQASAEETKGLANNTMLSVGSDQTALLSYLGSKGVKVDPKILILKQDSKTDSTLKSATATNTYDAALTNAISSNLETYMRDIQSAYEKATSPQAKKLLNDDYAHAQLLLKQAGASDAAKP